MKQKILSHRHFTINENSSEINITTLGDDIYTGTMSEDLKVYAINLRSAINEVMPFKIRRFKLSISIIPDGYRSSKTSMRVFYGNDLSAKFEVRATSDAETSTRLAIRDVAHELIHAILAMHGVQNKNPGVDGTSLEEIAAYTLENCIELRVIGTTSGDPLASQSERLSTTGSTASPIITSLNSGVRVNATLAALFADGTPTISKDDPRAATLDAICQDAINRAIQSASHR
jgi:hypothetical protein